MATYQSRLNDSFVEACRQGDLSLAKEIFAEGANLVAFQGLCMKEAVKAGHLDIVQFLWEQGFVVLANQTHPLTVAVLNGHLDIANYFIGIGTDPKVLIEAALVAAEYEKMDIFRVLYTALRDEKVWTFEFASKFEGVGFRTAAEHIRGNLQIEIIQDEIKDNPKSYKVIEELASDRWKDKSVRKNTPFFDTKCLAIAICHPKFQMEAFAVLAKEDLDTEIYTSFTYRDLLYKLGIEKQYNHIQMLKTQKILKNQTPRRPLKRR